MPANSQAFRVLSACPGCNRHEGRIVGSAAPAIVQQLGGAEFIQPEYMVIECATCGLLYKTPIPLATELAANYEIAPLDRYDYAYVQPPEKVVVRLLADLPPGACVLDFGCNTGRLLSMLPATIEKHGFEINEEAAAAASKRGIRLIKAESWLTPKAPLYDAIVLVDVFEHLDAPIDLLEKLWRNLKAGGRLILSTGNGDHWACRLDPGRFWYFRIYEHLCMMTRRFASYLAGRLDAVIEAWVPRCHYADALSVRIRSHTAHTIYWSHRKGPRWWRFILEQIPRVSALINSECPPPYACCQDHIIVSLRKKLYS